MGKAIVRNIPIWGKDGNIWGKVGEDLADILKGVVFKGKNMGTTIQEWMCKPKSASIHESVRPGYCKILVLGY